MKYIHNDSMLTHGAGAIYSVVIGKSRFTGKHLSFWIGGYGNVASPFGTFTFIPKITHYRRVAIHLTWLNMGISYAYLK